VTVRHPERRVVVVGASWGGLHALGRLLGGLPAGFELPLAVVLHRSSDGDELLCELLSRNSALAVQEAEDKAPLAAGCARIGPRGYHLLLEDGHVALSTEAPVHHSRPSIDVLFESAARAYGPSAIGVVLTGSNHDGAAGLRALRRRGAFAIVQDPADAERGEMPAAALAAAGADAVVALDGVAPLLLGLAG
jgi:two-component system, chemotaxis family, protein-glutamate methylesterase/glutaminase